jgi:hypothetical protein
MAEEPEEHEVSSEGVDVQKIYEEESIKRLREATRKYLKSEIE